MIFKVNDKVKFLDQVGEGIVKEVLNEFEVMIEDDDGFDYKVNSKELIKISDSINESKAYENHSPSDTSIFTKDVNRDRLEAAQDEFKDKYSDQQFRYKGEVMEVDLHIHELLDYTKGMSNSEMLDHQVRHFERMMKIAERKKVNKVVFIHGVGEGVLRAEIRRLIEQFYPNCSFRDGNYKDYGIGATQIDIRYN